jgi:hypothetical protein
MACQKTRNRSTQNITKGYGFSDLRYVINMCANVGGLADFCTLSVKK